MTDELISQLQSFGLNADSPILDNNIQRVAFRGSRDLRGWYVGSNLNGNIYCTYGSWDKPDEIHKYTNNGGDSVEANAQWKFLAEIRRGQKERDQKRAAIKAEKIIESAPVCPADHPYLVAKGIKPVAGTKFEKKTKAILVPMYEKDGGITSLQRIFPDGTKKMLYNGKKQGSCFVIHGRVDEAVCICEGLATGASINEATGYKVLVAFDIGNLKHVAMQAADRFPKIIICADNDHTKENNVGLTRGKEIAGKIPWVTKLCYPTDILGTDFNDLHQEKGIGAVRKTVMAATGEKIMPKPLSRANLAPVSKWVSADPPVIDWVLDGLIPAGAVGAMPGMGGTGKSNLSLLIARAVATGRPVEPFRPTKPRPVLLLNVEDSADDQWRRLHAQTRLHPLSEKEIALLEENLMIYPGRGEVGPLMGLEGANPCESSWGRWFAESVENLKPDFIILDTKSRLYGLDENSNDHASQWLSYIERIATDNNAAVLILHHTAKARSGDSDQLSSRGASAFIDNARFCFSLTNISDHEAKRYALDDPKLFFKMELVKGNYTAPCKAWFFRKGEAGCPELVDLEVDRLSSAADMLHELLFGLKEPVTWRELRDRPKGSEIRKILRDEHGVTRGILSKIWDMLIDSKRAILDDIRTETTGQIRTVIVPQVVEAAKAQ